MSKPHAKTNTEISHVIKFNHPPIEDRNLIVEHLCYLHNFYVYDVDNQLTDMRYLLYIMTDKYRINQELVNAVKEDAHIEHGNYILLLPEQFHGRNYCLYVETFMNMRGQQIHCGLLSDNYLIIFQEMNEICRTYYNQFLELVNSKLVLESLKGTLF